MIAKSTAQKRNQLAHRLFYGSFTVFALTGCALYTWAAYTTHSHDGSAIFLVAAIAFGMVAAMTAVECAS